MLTWRKLATAGSLCREHNRVFIGIGAMGGVDVGVAVGIGVAVTGGVAVGVGVRVVTSPGVTRT